jgi:ribonuclease VapC
MVVDTSALVAILSDEPERRAFIEAISTAPVRLISAATLLEAGINGRDAAGLNFGDCFSYALAKASGERLLFKSNDFARTDVPTVA